jgi:Asp-tRNA(Asn)/Glu-tRNA(Gln) amidotransferase A subunit family amidase
VIPLSDGKELVPQSTLTSLASYKTSSKDGPGRFYTVADYHNLYLSGALTPLAVVESILPLIRRDLTPRSNHSVAWIDTNVEEVLTAARLSTQRYKDGSSLGLLDGIPIGIKDEASVAGYRTTLGRKMDEKRFPIQTETDYPIQNWQDCGAIIMGKLNMHEIGMGK